jgi:hypothetical protein
MNSIGTTYRLFALLLAGLMLLSTLNLFIDAHYCKGELKSVALFGKAKSCHAPAREKSKQKICPNHPPQQQESSFEKRNCCQNKSFHIDADIDEQVQIQNVMPEWNQEQLILAFVQTFFTTDVSLALHDAPVFERYKPPLIARDIHVLFETYIL